MALDTSKMSGTLANLHAQAGEVSVTISSTVYKGARMELHRDVVYGDAGLGDEYRFSVAFATSVLPLASVPAPQSSVTIASTTYRVLKAHQDALQLGTRLDLGERFAQ